MYTPYFNSSDLIPVAPNSTGLTVTPSTQQIEKLNTYDIVRRDPVLRDSTTAQPARIRATPQPAERMTTRSKNK